MELGIKQTLVCLKTTDFGIYLGESMDSEEKVLLPIKQVRPGTRPGDEVEVFLYKDSQDRPIATINTPLVTLHDVARLTVKEVAKIGAFLDWGLEKDLLLPFSEQTRKVKAGEKVLVALYVDKSSRLAATMNVYKYLSQDSPYKKDDRVSGTVYELSDNFGAFVAVDDKYSALIPKRELFGKAKIGDEVSCRVVEVKEDGKLTLGLREKTPVQMNVDGQTLVELMEKQNGSLGFGESATPEFIKLKTGMSKGQFKRAVGHLLKEGKIAIKADDIVLK